MPGDDGVSAVAFRRSDLPENAMRSFRGRPHDDDNHRSSDLAAHEPRKVEWLSEG